jgi:predicted small lipoprotein YifL
LGTFFVNGRHGSTAAKIALLGAAALLIALGGCGRKAGLDPPPMAAAPQSPTDQAAAAQPASNPLAVLNPFQADEQSAAPRQGPKKRIVLDRILD